MQSPIAVLALRRIALTRVQHEEGQDLLEYALLIGLIALVAIGAVASVGNAVYTFFWQTIAQNF
jgi:Flp pilus assembly pilin Flp